MEHLLLIRHKYQNSVRAICVSSKVIKIKRHRAMQVHERSRGGTTRADWNSQPVRSDGQTKYAGTGREQNPGLQAHYTGKNVWGFKCDNYMKKWRKMTLKIILTIVIPRNKLIQCQEASYNCGSGNQRFCTITRSWACFTQSNPRKLSPQVPHKCSSHTSYPHHVSSPKFCKHFSSLDLSCMNNLCKNLKTSVPWHVRRPLVICSMHIINFQLI